ncbi:MAG: phage tail tape measure protein [Candidatus Lokiarchaeota archaeon]|nr:phage tail tape measure protein [Candidatus Lokiarchaeota archaeon]
MANPRIQVVINAQDNASKVFKKLGTQLETTSKKMASVGKKMSLGITAPIAGIGAMAIKSSADFDTLTRAAAQMNKGTGKNLEAMKKDIRALSKITIQDTNKMAKAYYDVGSAGFKGAEGLEILEISGKAATGGLADVDAVTSTLVKTLSMFNKRGDEAGIVMDRLNGIVDTGIITFSQLAGVFPTAAAQADALGISIEETGAALAVVTKKAGSAEEAATAINAVFTQLVKPTDALREAINEMGYENSQAAIKSLGLTGVLKELNNKVGGNVEAMGEMFGNVRAIKAVIPLLNDDVSEYNATLETINNSQGRTNELFNDMVEGPGAKMRLAWIKIKIALAEFGDVALPIVVQFISKLEILFEKFQQLNPEQRKAIVIALALAAALGPVLIVMATLITVIGIVLSPIGLLIIAFGVLIGLVYTLYKNFDSFKASLVVIGKYIKEVFNGIIDGLSNKISGLINKISEALRKLAEMAKKASIGGVGAWLGGGIQSGLSAAGIPHLAEGGIVNKPTLAMIGEAGTEAVIPLNKGRGIGGITVNINGGNYLSEDAAEDIGDKIIDRLKYQIKI